MICLSCKHPTEVFHSEYINSVICQYANFRNAMTEKCRYYKPKDKICKSLKLVWSSVRTKRSVYDTNHKFAPFYKNILVEYSRNE